MAPEFASDIELIRAEAIDAIHALMEHFEVGASSRWGPFFACIGERNYPKAASFYETLAVKGDLSFASALASVLANLWQARYEEARSAASRLADGSTFDERSYERIIELIDFVTEVEGTYARRDLADARPRVPAKTRFVILHDARVGSSWVVASLNQHERVICYPEFLVEATAEQQAKLLSLMSAGGLPEIFGVYAVAPKYHPVSPYRKKYIDAVGFKTKLNDVRDHSWFRTFLKENEFKVVRLYREDFLKQAVSWCNAERLFSERGQYNVRRGIDERTGPLRLDSERLMEMISQLREERETTDEFVKTLELPTLSLSYEEILEEPSTAASRLGACLEIDGLILGTTFAKATSDTLEEAVENWARSSPL